MPPKGSRSAPAELGRVFPHGNGFRVQASVNGAPDKGPCRPTRARANADLHRAQSAQSLEEYVHILELLRREAKPPDPSDVSAQVPSSRVTQPTAKVLLRLPEGASRVIRALRRAAVRHDTVPQKSCGPQVQNKLPLLHQEM